MHGASEDCKQRENVRINKTKPKQIDCPTLLDRQQNSAASQADILGPGPNILAVILLCLMQ